MSEAENQRIPVSRLDEMIQNLNSKVEAVYRHAALQEDYSTEVHDYGDGYYMTEVEAHTLGYICDHKDMTVTHLAAYSCRTKGSVSKMLKKLEEKGLITRSYKEGNRKWTFFSATEQGMRVNENHRSYDRIKTMEMIEVLLKDCTLEEIESFYKVTELRNRFLEQKRNAREKE